ncbi:unnamed protein product [Chironomus riparius]|uniref:Uncharacterized protein n=1 Tax=Chironomus riparius TaxID=315576 RepID=A0A9N9WN06_9DIPT|nr:unnamed protein product [Chironomus riparius]
MAERLRTISVGECDSDIGINDIFSSSIHSEPSLMNTSQISTSSQDSQQRHGGNLSKSPHNLQSKQVGSSSCRFPKLEECAHFHYERVQLGNILIRLIEDKPDIVVGAGSLSQDQQSHWFIINVSAGRSEPFLIKRSLQNMKMLDQMLHQCVYDRRVSDLQDLSELSEFTDEEELLDTVDIYLSRLSRIASDSMTCGSVLTWLQLDNKGRRLPVADSDTMLTINTPAVGAAYGIRRYVAQACDEISIEVGDMISVIDMPSPAESLWWRGKKNHFQKNQYEVGFFPQNCVATIGEKVPRHMPLPAPLVGSLAISPTKPVLRKHGKLITFFRSFILARPSRRRLKQSGIYKERVFSCDLGEHLMNSGQEIPQVLKSCAEFIEQFGIVDGVYRLSGITSNIQKLRRAFDEERIPDLTQPDIKQDIHAVTSLLKMYFRELPNPLCTYQLYDNFVEAIQARSDGEDLRLKMVKQTVRKLPPPHYRTLKYLACHLCRIAKHSAKTGMTERNIAIVWAPNLLRSPALESGGVAALRGVGVQAVVTEYLIVNSVAIFADTNEDYDFYNNSQPHSLSDTSSLQIDQRDASLSMIERPKSLGIGPPKLISLEEAQIRKNQREVDKAMPIIPTSTHNACSSYIEVGGGPASLPEKYHTVLPVPRSWNKRKTNSWKSIFQRGGGGRSSNIKSKLISNPIAAKETVSKIEKKINEMRKELPVIVSANSSNNSSFKEKKLAKSADALDMGPKSLTNEVTCPRSCSIDSLRTPGHSRSVSHDSYFDILQSPLRGITACPSRELSELVLNFDREEPEMRIFSESESLVSSPKVVKDSVPRRILRARPEEYSSGGNSINPSPKKQPRLNLSSPNELKTWATIISEVSSEGLKEKADYESTSCKRYKFEDQLSDLQFIDCNTPEHLVTTVSGNTGYTIYTSIQIHSPPSLYDNKEQHKTIIDTNSSTPLRSESERYSYPVTQYTTFAATKKEDRFSYPIAINASSPKQEKEIIKGSNENVYQMNISESPPVSNKKSNTIDVSSSPSKMVVKDVQRSNSEVFNKKNEMNRSKLSVATPQSPVKSPCYSLLIGSTASSASSSPVNTPINYDMDICNVYEPISFTNAKDNKDNVVSVMQTSQERRDSKKGLSLDLMRNTSKINVLSSPNTPQILTANSDRTTTTETAETTSQSITPSEIHYENLSFNRQSMTPEISPRVDDMHHNSFVVKPTIVHVPSPTLSTGKTSPIKSTINITYNLKSPSSVKSDGSEQKFFADDFKKTDYEIVSKEGLLETAFDDSMVYEQVKFYRNAVEEVNDLVDEKPISLNSYDNEEIQEIPNLDKEDEAEVEEHYEIVFKNDKMLLSDIQMKESIQSQNNQEKEVKDHEIETQDSLEFEENISLYENVEVKIPPKIYENVPLPPSLPSSPVRQMKSNSEKGQDITDKEVQKISTESKSSPTNFSNVRKLATRFETSPVDVQPPFDFHRSPSHRSRPDVQLRKNNRNADMYTITRSLDENAFIREFGSARKFEEFNKSINEIADLSSLSSSSSDRRKSTDYSKPKVLNPPKKLPGFSSNISEAIENCKKSVDYADGNGHKLKLNIGDSGELIETQKSPANERQPLQTFNVRITPTTENRISLIQTNFETGLEKKTLADEEKSTSTTSLTSLKMLKLDRERIEKIKEERRHQLNEKYRSDSFRNLNNNVKLSKPKSKQEINIDDDFNDEICTTHRFKSKSRNELDYEQPISLINTTTASSSTQNLITTSSNRIRRISDEKNQNDIDSGIDDQVVLKSKDASELRESKYENKIKPKIEKRSFELTRERNNSSGSYRYSQNSNQNDRYSPQISIKDVAAIFESRASQQTN